MHFYHIPREGGTVVFGKVKTDKIFDGVRFCLWELLHTTSSPSTKGSKQFMYKEMTLLNNVEEIL